MQCNAIGCRNVHQQRRSRHIWTSARRPFLRYVSRPHQHIPSQSNISLLTNISNISLVNPTLCCEDISTNISLLIYPSFQFYNTLLTITQQQQPSPPPPPPPPSQPHDNSLVRQFRKVYGKRVKRSAVVVNSATWRTFSMMI